MDTPTGYVYCDGMPTYSVIGMTCGHCANSVATEIGRIPGVTGVTVDLAAGSVAVDATEPPARETVRAAVEEAGYELGEES